MSHLAKPRATDRAKKKSAPRLITAKQLARMSLPDQPCELVEGKIIFMSPSDVTNHGVVVGRILRFVVLFVAQHDIGMVMSAEAGFLLREKPDTVRAPDVTYMSWERLRLGKELGGTFSKMAPELAIEVLSPSNTTKSGREDMAKKVKDFLDAGTLAVWIFDPETSTIAVHIPGASPKTLGADDDLDGGAALPGFRVRVRRFFEDDAR